MVYGRSACTAIAGPRSEPPMPMFTTRVKGLPELPTMRPARTFSAKVSMCSRSVITTRAMSAAPDVRSRRLPQRHVQHRAPFGGVDLLAAPHRVAVVLQAHRLGQLEELAEHHLIEMLAREIHQQARALAREALEAARVAREELAGRDRVQPRRHGWPAPARGEYGDLRPSAWAGSSGGLLGWGHGGRVEALDCTGHVVDLRRRELREDRQRQHLAAARSDSGSSPARWPR